MALGRDETEHRFGFHKATTQGPEATAPRHEFLRAEYKAFAAMLDGNLPDSREKSLALTALQEASMWTHAAIAMQAPLVSD